MPSPLSTMTYRMLFKGIDFFRLDTCDTRCAAAITLGFALGLSPLYTLHAVVLLAMGLCFRVNPLVVAGSYLFFFCLAAPFDPLFHQIGLDALTPAPLQRLWAGFYHWPLLPHTHFYNTVVMGRALVVALAVAPLFFGSRRLLQRHRKTLLYHFEASQFWRVIAGSRFYRFYVSYHQ